MIITAWLLACLAMTTLSPSSARHPEPPALIVPSTQIEMEKVLDIPYYTGVDADEKKHKLDLFLPKGKKNFPVLFFVHGGSWTSGDRKMYGNMGTVFTKHGLGVVVISYRLSPAITHPEHIVDVARAFDWTVKNISKYGGNTDEIFVSGHSAGAHLVSLLATNGTYLKAHNLTAKNIKGVIPISGIYMVPEGVMTNVVGKSPGAALSASPTQHVTGKEPPMLVLYADQDFGGCGAMSKVFVEKLTNAKVSATIEEITGRTHVSIMSRILSSDADPASQLMLTFIAKHTKGRPAGKAN